jgi:hypothetical protein
MKSFTEGRNLYGSLTKNTATANLALGDQFANDDYRALCALHDWPWLERLRTLTTVASTANYVLPYDCDQVREVAVIVSSYRYTPKPVPDQKFWDQLNQSSYTSDTPEYYRIFNGQLYLWPTPASSGNTINITQKTRVIDLSIADYTTGTIVTATNGLATIVGSATSWTSQMVGRYIRITHSNTANTGDGLWYEIAGVTDTTHLTLTRNYGGTSIATGTAAYTIGQMPLLPEAFQDLPWLYAAGQYWIKESDNRGPDFLTLHGNIGAGSVPSTGKVALLEKAWSSATTNLVIDDGEDNIMLNPNLTINL